MSDLWVAVTAEYGGSTFSHRATVKVDDDVLPLSRAFKLACDDAAWRVFQALGKQQ
jgi:hypothetical protein